jgi:ATP-dependent helicase/nuclease subunit B
LRSYLFSSQKPGKPERDQEVCFFSAPGEGRECVEIARRGTSFDQMAVLLRASSAYAALLETALARAQIPAYFTRGSRRPDPSGRAFLAILGCAAEGLSARRFAEYLTFRWRRSRSSTKVERRLRRLRRGCLPRTKR